MNRYVYPGLYVLIVPILFFCCSSNNNDKDTIDTLNVESQEPIAEQNEKPADMKVEIPLGMQALMAAYPDFIESFDNNTVVFKDGSTMIYDDGKEKDFDTLLDNSSLKDMFYCVYTVGDSNPEYLSDAGRSRNEEIFKKMYGSSPEAVNKNMETVNWFGQKLPFTKINGASAQLRKVAEELAQYPELKKYLKSAGTYYWRKVRGANRQSAHSYGIAIDLGIDYSNYWKWDNANAKETDKINYKNRFPKQIADIFRKYGFIWGGGWYHYDTMHFEYRPEILEYAELYTAANPDK